MVLHDSQIAALMRSIGKTRDHELNCNECLDKMGEFAEGEIAGKRVPVALEGVGHHLSVCAECTEEYEALLTALRKTEADEGR